MTTDLLTPISQANPDDTEYPINIWLDPACCAPTVEERRWSDNFDASGCCEIGEVPQKYIRADGEQVLIAALERIIDWENPLQHPKLTFEQAYYDITTYALLVVNAYKNKRK